MNLGSVPGYLLPNITVKGDATKFGFRSHLIALRYVAPPVYRRTLSGLDNLK
jgi:hypothetical protein